MGTFTTKDDVQLYYKDWGTGPVVVLSHGWPLSSDSWESQQYFLADNGYRVIAHDRRGHGRSSQPWDGNDMDHYADDLAQLLDHLDVRDIAIFGFSTGGGEVARYIGRHGTKRVAKAVLLSAVPPLMLKTESNPEGTDLSVFYGFRAALTANRAEFFQAVASGPFYGFNRPGVTTSEPVVANWWRQGMTGSALAHYEGIKAFSETDQTEDLKAITVPVLVTQGDDDQIVPYKDASIKQAELLPNATLKIYEGYPHGMLTTHADVINPDLLAFIQQ